jgi:hypothetical protein
MGDEVFSSVVDMIKEADGRENKLVRKCVQRLCEGFRHPLGACLLRIFVRQRQHTPSMAAPAQPAPFDIDVLPDAIHRIHSFIDSDGLDEDVCGWILGRDFVDFISAVLSSSYDEVPFHDICLPETTTSTCILHCGMASERC